MDNFDLFSSHDGEEKKESKTSLEFEISENPLATDTPAEVEPGATEEINVEKTEPVHVKEEFSIPESFEVDSRYTSGSFMESPGAIRPTYLPRFTEVSETYRMQNDSRPRPKADAPVIKVETEAEREEEVKSELDPTTERLEETEVEKVVVTSATARSIDLADETFTVLKFSTDTDDAADEDTMSAEERAEIEEIASIESLTAPASEEESTAADTDGSETPAEEKDTDVPEPDVAPVIEFVAPDVTEIEEPLGASDAESSSRTDFTSPAQRDSVKDKFLDTLMSIRVRLAGAAILLLALVAIDVLDFFGINVLGYVGLGRVTYARAVVDMQFSICIFLLTLPEFVGAVGQLTKGKIVPELINVLSLVTIVLNAFVITISGAESYLTFGVLYGLQCLVTVIASYAKTKSSFASFKIVSRNVAKNVVDKRLTRELTRENLALDGAVDEYSSKTARMFRTTFVSNFFKRSSVSCENSANTAMMMGIGTGLALITGLVAFLVNGNSMVAGTQSLAIVFMLSYPVSSILVHKLPLKHVSERAALEESAFVGESSVFEGADVDVFTYDDTEIFGIEDVSIQKVHLYGKAYNTPKAMKEMYALFSVVGGPLDYVFSSALDRKCSPATDVIIEDNGISGMMGGHRICAGTEEYMLSHGITIPEDDYKTNIQTSGSTKIMYGADDGEVYVKFFIRYSFSEEFTMLLPDLKEKRIVPLVYTRDPNITAELIKVLTLGEDVIRVMKKYSPLSSEDKTYRAIDSGMVTHGNKDSAINMILLAKKYASFQTSLAATELISMIVGAVLAVVLAVGDMLVIPATLLSLWQVVWCVVLYVRSRLTFQAPTETPDESEVQ